MFEEKENAGNSLETAPTTDESNATEQCEETKETETDELVDSETVEAKTFTQDQVNELVRKRIERERSKVYERYGVGDKKGLDDLISKSQSYDVMKERIEAIRQQNAQMTQKLAFIENNINPDKEGDVLAHFKGKDMSLDSATLKSELATHPEWLKVKTVENKPITTIKNISTERGKTDEVNEKEEIAKLFGLERIL